MAAAARSSRTRRTAPLPAAGAATSTVTASSTIATSMPCAPSSSHASAPSGSGTERAGKLCRRPGMKRMSFAALVVAMVMSAAVADAQTKVKPGFNLFSPQDDAQIGAQSAAEAERQMPIVRDANVENYVNSIGQRLAANAGGPQFRYQFRVVNASDINAFALPGGYVYVNRGVLGAARGAGHQRRRRHRPERPLPQIQPRPRVAGRCARRADPRRVGLLAGRHGELLLHARESRHVAQDELAVRSPGAARPHQSHPAGSADAARLADADDERGRPAERAGAAARLRRRADDGADLAHRPGRGV